MPVVQSPTKEYRVERLLEMAALTSLREVYQHPTWTLQSIAIASGTTGHGAMVAVGDGASIVYGILGRAPTAQTAAASYSGSFWDVCTNNAGAWVAVGDAGQVQSSTNGTTWTSQRSGGVLLNAIAFGNGVYTAVGPSGLIITCPNANGSGWTTRTSAFGTGVELCSLIFVPELGNLWICATRDGRIQTATDPTGTWSPRYTVPGTSPLFIFRSIAYNAFLGGVVALYRRNTNEVGFATSADGVNWTTTGSQAGWLNLDALRFSMLDRSLVVWDYFSSPSDLIGYVLRTPDILSEKKFITANGKIVVRGSRNANGQMFLVGQINGGPGTVQASTSFRPNSIAEI